MGTGEAVSLCSSRRHGYKDVCTRNPFERLSQGSLVGKSSCEMRTNVDMAVGAEDHLYSEDYEYLHSLSQSFLNLGSGKLRYLSFQTSLITYGSMLP